MTEPHKPTISVGVTDDYDPEVRAMLMAMYSRSYASIADRLPSTDEDTAAHKAKLGKYYVQWGHKSVGQLGSTDIFIEGVSQLAAKAIENHPLYNGQESSTRYIDFTNQPMVIPGIEATGLTVSQHYALSQWQETYRDLYVLALEKTAEKVWAESGIDKATATLVETNTVRARTFDICRGLLPAGGVTNVAFSGTFDTINDHFGEMLYHPAPEMREIAKTVLTGLGKKYPYAAIPIEKLLERYSYVRNDHFYNEVNSADSGRYGDRREKIRNSLSRGMGFIELDSAPCWPTIELRQHISIDRKKYEKFPDYRSKHFHLNYINKIDFGSFRDLHRHRNGKINMPILTPLLGYGKYYMDNLPEEVRSRVETTNRQFAQWYREATTIPDVYKQYAVPMGFEVAFEYQCDLNQVIYILEMRSAKTVHQTLRNVVHDWARKLWGILPELNLHVDFDTNNWSLKRGEQTILQDKK